MKINELQINETYNVPLVVINVAAKKTRNQKDYLWLEFTDGKDTIQGNYWDWLGSSMPSVNDILNVNCAVSEWQGVKQLTVKGLTRNTELTLNDFNPTSNADIAQTYKDAYEMASVMCNDVLRGIALASLEELKEHWLTVPGAMRVHHNYIGGTLVHSLEVAKIAYSIAVNIPEANTDLCIAGGLLHDIGKLFTYKIDGLNVEMTNEGMLYDHIFMGAEFIGNFADNHIDADDADNQRVLRILRHIILSHHGRKEYGSPVEPACIEAYIVHHADSLSATAEQIRSAALPDKMWTDKIYMCGNKPHLNPEYVKDVLEESDLPF